MAISPSVAAAARVSAPAVNVRRSRELEGDVLGSRLIGLYSSACRFALRLQVRKLEPWRLSKLYAGQDIGPRELVLGYVSKDGRIVLAVLTPIHAFSLCRRQILINKGCAFQASSPKLSGSALR
jgi:hypothetical protein